MPKSKDDPREFENESLRGCSMDEEEKSLRRLGKISGAKDKAKGCADIAEYFMGIPPELLVGLPEAIKGLPEGGGESMKDILAGAQLALEIHDMTEEDEE